MRTRRIFALFIAVAFIVTAQTAPLTRQQIIEMTKSGLPEDVIIARIRAEKSPLKVSTDDLIALKSAAVSDGIIRAVMGVAPSSVASGTPVAAAPATVSDADDPLSPHDAGVYLLGTTRDGKKKMILIERAGSNRAKTANILGAAFTYGISKAKIKAELPGARAATRARESRPEFYMYFPPTGNLGAADTISSPSQFVLLALEVKTDSRETTIGKMGFASASSGADEKKTLKFNTEKIRPYAFKIIPDASLHAGEYAFIASAGMGGNASAPNVVIFDFGVDQ
jgi:hypothetical protein